MSSALNRPTRRRGRSGHRPISAARLAQRHGAAGHGSARMSACVRKAAARARPRRAETPQPEPNSPPDRDSADPTARDQSLLPNLPLSLPVARDRKQRTCDGLVTKRVTLRGADRVQDTAAVEEDTPAPATRSMGRLPASRRLTIPEALTQVLASGRSSGTALGSCASIRASSSGPTGGRPFRQHTPSQPRPNVHSNRASPRLLIGTSKVMDPASYSTGCNRRPRRRSPGCGRTRRIQTCGRNRAHARTLSRPLVSATSRLPPWLRTLFSTLPAGAQPPRCPSPPGRGISNTDTRNAL